MKPRATLSEIRQNLARGGAVLLPTETVWGLAARVDRPEGISAIYNLKGRDDGKPLAVCVADASIAAQLAHISGTAKGLMDAHWPGPLTLVLPLKEGLTLHPQTTSTDGIKQTIGLRCPDVSWRAGLCDQPLALTSANLSGQPAVTRESEARATFPDTPFLPDDAPDKNSAPTTIVRIDGDKVTVLRQGDLIIKGTE